MASEPGPWKDVPWRFGLRGWAPAKRRFVAIRAPAGSFRAKRRFVAIQAPAGSPEGLGLSGLAPEGPGPPWEPKDVSWRFGPLRGASGAPRGFKVERVGARGPKAPLGAKRRFMAIRAARFRSSLIHRGAGLGPPGGPPGLGPISVQPNSPWGWSGPDFGPA